MKPEQKGRIDLTHDVIIWEVIKDKHSLRQTYLEATSSFLRSNKQASNMGNMSQCCSMPVLCLKAQSLRMPF